MEKLTNQPEHTQLETKVSKEIKRRSFIAFGTFAVLQVSAYLGWRKMYTSPDEIAGITKGAQAPLRRALNQNELFFRRLFFSEKHLVKTYPKEMAAKRPRVNSMIGLEGKHDLNDWKLSVTRSPGDVLDLTIDDIKTLPKTEIVFSFKCVEGWDQIQHWGGVKFSDFIEHYRLHKQTQFDYVGMATPDGKYYVGLDMASAMHPQTLLAYELNDKAIGIEHGAPLRLIIPVKYGIKNLKRISSITFSNTRPRDYWAEQGYDYYSGL
jgi:hypothetical protein